MNQMNQEIDPTGLLLALCEKTRRQTRAALASTVRLLGMKRTFQEDRRANRKQKRGGGGGPSGMAFA